MARKKRANIDFNSEKTSRTFAKNKHLEKNISLENRRSHGKLNKISDKKTKKNNAVKKSKKYRNRKFSANFELAFLFLYSLIITLIVEAISRRGIEEAVDFVTKNTLNFFVNYILVVIIFSLTVFFKRKRFVTMVISVILLALSTSSSMLDYTRGMPLSPYDFMAYKEAFQISNVFISLRFIIITVVITLIVLIFSVVLFLKDKNKKRLGSRRNTMILFAIASLYFIVVPQLKDAKIIYPLAWDLSESYRLNGFTLSFIDESISSFRKAPKGYSESEIKKIRKEVDEKKSKDGRRILSGKNRPNIVFVQLEAFMDPVKIPDTSFSEDPMPNMRRLMKNYTSGYMNVPVTGGGTARTEYEVLSGSDFDFLNQGEIPYHTFLSEKPSLSLATDLKKSGYTSVAIHNFYRNFYNRSNGYQNLGFDKFLPMETMNNIEYTPMGWPKDKVLTSYIMKEATKNKFIFTVSTQGHSRYPSANLDKELPIEVKSGSWSKSDLNQITYYTNQVKEMDDFIGKLVDEINKSKKPTVLVLYGDHLPGITGFKKLNGGLDLYSSLFAVVNNFGVKKQEIGKNFQANELSTLVLKVAGQNYGPMGLVHAYLKDDKDYKRKLELVQYDILFGKKYFLKENELPKKNIMQVGNKDIEISKIENRSGDFYIRGKNFNRDVYTYIDGKKVDSDYVDETTIRLYDNYYSGEKTVFLRQLDHEGDTIFQTKSVKYKFVN